MRLIFGIFIYGIQVRGFFCGFSCGFLCEGAENNAFGVRCTDRNASKVPSYPYKRRVKSSFGRWSTDKNASKELSYPYKRSVDSSYTT